MNCQDFPWVDYLERRLPEAVQASAQAHLAGCPACRVERERWELLLAEGARVAPGSRLGCPHPPVLAALAAEAAGSEGLWEAGAAAEPARAWARTHLDSCARCREEVAALRTLYGADAKAERVPLPADLARALWGEGAPAAVPIAAEVMELVRARFGSASAALEVWRQGLARILAATRPDWGGAAPGFAALAAAGEEALCTGPLELTVRSGDLDVEVRLHGPWVRLRARRFGAPQPGVTIRVENELGEIAETETDVRGEASVREDLPGLRRIRVGNGGKG